jgi:HEPN domain-containing protein
MPGFKDWIKKASSDLKASKKLSDDIETLDCAVYHTHQCAEKALKAFIILTHQAIPKTHDLGFLLTQCTKIDFELISIQEESRALNSYGVEARYPNDFFRVDESTALHAIDMAEKILITVKSKI